MKQLEPLLRQMRDLPLLAQQTEALTALLQRAQNSEVLISVIGQFKRGKSSLLNAMLGEPLLSVGILPLTTVVTEIRWGETFRAQVFFADGTSRQIDRADLPAYCTEQENPGNCKGVRTVAIETPHQPFGPGIVLADTPGVGSIHHSDTQTAYAHVERSDAVLFLLSVDSPLSQAEHDFLLAARAYAPKFYFVVNKADTVSPADLALFLDFCTQALTDALRADLRASHAQLLADSLQQKAAVLLAQTRSKLTLALQSADLSAGALREKLARLRSAQREITDFADGLEGLSRRRTAALVEDIRTRLDAEAAALKTEAEAENQRLYAQHQTLSPALFRERMRTGIDAMLAPRLQTMNQHGTALLREGYHDLTALLHQKVRAQETCAAQLLQEAFGVAYPLEGEACAVSDADDFFLQIGIQSLPHGEFAHRFLPRKAADRRFLQENLRRAWEEIDCNENNMLSNYRYQMQESLRTLDSAMAQRLERLSAELDTLRTYLDRQLQETTRSRDAEICRLRQLLALVDAQSPQH